jgi:hypothetical protein
MMSNKRFFQGEEDDSGVTYTVVARDIDHAKQIMRDSGAEFGDPSGPFDQVPFEWVEVDAERATRIKCNRDDGNPSVPLAECDLGDRFCSEW